MNKIQVSLQNSQYYEMKSLQTKDLFADYIREYFFELKEEIKKLYFTYGENINDFTKLLINAEKLEKEVMLFGMGVNNHIVNHANVDFMKFNHLKTVNLNIPMLTAYGNDYRFPRHIKELLKHRSFGEKDVFIGIQTERVCLLEETFQYNHINGGINILITNEMERSEYVDMFFSISSKNQYIAMDIIQMILHFVSVNTAYQQTGIIYDAGAYSLKDYCTLLVASIDGLADYYAKIAEAGLEMTKKLFNNNKIFAFGNGGSSALCSYFIDVLREQVCAGNLFDITSFTSSITTHMNLGNYQSSVFSDIIKKLGGVNEDVLVGISSSGNSKNVLHPFTQFKNSTRIGILGFNDGGLIGKLGKTDIALIFPDAGGYKSYQRAEDGQRIILSSILNALNKMIYTNN